MAADVLMFVSAVAIAVCFLSLAWFINHLGLLERNGSVFASLSPGSAIPSQSLVGTANPFSLEVSERRSQQRDDVAQGVTATVSCQVPCFITCYWGVQQSALTRLLDNSNDDDDEEYEETDEDPESFDQLLAGSHLGKSETEFLERSQDFNIHFQPEDGFAENFKELQNQQSLHPLVIAMEMASETRQMLDQQYHVVAFLSLLGFLGNNGNLKIIQQCVQTLDGKVFTVQKLFVSETDAEPGHISDDREQPLAHALCVVCQTDPVTRALLPCRHACLCGHCFQRLNQCPVCRSVITSYFLVQKEPRNLQEDGGLSQYLQQMSWWEIPQRIFSAS